MLFGCVPVSEFKVLLSMLIGVEIIFVEFRSSIFAGSAQTMLADFVGFGLIYVYLSTKIACI